MFSRSEFLTVAVLFLLSSCAQKQDEWSGIDYSKVYQAAGQRRDNDTRYKAPTVVGCVDDDLFNCK